MTDGLANWLGAGKVVEILKATRDLGIWKDMMAYAIKHGTDDDDDDDDDMINYKRCQILGYKRC